MKGKNLLRRIAFAVAVGAALALSTGVPASAQYGGGGGGTTTTTASTTTTTEAPPAEQPRVIADVSDSEVAPGDPVTVTTPSVFAPGSTVTVNIVGANATAEPGELATSQATQSGAVTNTSTIPDLPPGVYFIYVTGVDSDGNPVVALVPIVIRAADTAEATAFQAAAAPVPAQVAEVQSDLPADTEAAIVEAVTAGDAGLLLSPEGPLSVRTPDGVQAAGALPTTGSDGIATQVAVGAALLLAGTGLVLMRRRGFAK